MSKWKCEICGSGFDNFHAQCFDNMIYCPLCYFKKLSADLQVENEKLKKQLDYLRSGKYYNQLRFENEMLQQVVDTNGVPSEVYDYLESVHKNTEFLEQQQEFIKYLKSINSFETVGSILKKYKEIIGGK